MKPMKPMKLWMVTATTDEGMITKTRSGSGCIPRINPEYVAAPTADEAIKLATFPAKVTPFEPEEGDPAFAAGWMEQHGATVVAVEADLAHVATCLNDMVRQAWKLDRLRAVVGAL